MRNWTRSDIHNLKPLGGGGGGDAYRAQLAGSDGFDLNVVVKLARTGSRASDHGVIDEANLLAKLADHPNIVRVLDRGHCELSPGVRVPYLMLEYGGCSLQQLQRNCGRMDPILAAHVAVEICEGLAHVHSFDIVHRDIKPGNVLIGRFGQVKLIDFGIAKAENRLQVTETGMVKGSIHYTAPEMLQQGEVDARADLWSAGIVLYEMLAGHVPWTSTRSAAQLAGRREIGEQICAAKPPELPEGLDADLRAIVRRLLEKKPEDRYQNAEAVIQALLRTTTSLHRRTAAVELGQQARASEDFLSRKPTIDPGESTVNVHAERRGQVTLGSMQLSMSSSDNVMEHDSDSERWFFDTSAKHMGLGADDSTDVVGTASPLVPARARSRLPAAGLLLGACSLAAVLIWRGGWAGESAPPPTPVASVAHADEGPSTASPAAKPALPAREESAPVPEPASTGEALVAPPPAEAAQPSAEETPPQLEEERGKAAPRASLRVLTVPSGAFVSLDGQKPVASPAEFSGIRPGRHLVRSGLAPNQLSKEERVKLSSGPNQLRIQLVNPFASPLEGPFADPLSER